jgi:hypothetical protein
MLFIQFQSKHWAEILHSLGEQTVLVLGSLPVGGLIKPIYLHGGH